MTQIPVKFTARITLEWSCDSNLVCDPFGQRQACSAAQEQRRLWGLCLISFCSTSLISVLSKTTYSDDRSHIRRIKRIQVFLLDNSRRASCSRRATIILIVLRKFSNTHDISIGHVFLYYAVSKAVLAPSFTGITLEPRSNITPQRPVMMLTIWFSLENRRQKMPSRKKTDTF